MHCPLTFEQCHIFHCIVGDKMKELEETEKSMTIYRTHDLLITRWALNHWATATAKAKYLLVDVFENEPLDLLLEIFRLMRKRVGHKSGQVDQLQSLRSSQSNITTLLVWFEAEVFKFFLSLLDAIIQLVLWNANKLMKATAQHMKIKQNLNLFEL